MKDPCWMLITTGHGSKQLQFETKDKEYNKQVRVILGSYIITDPTLDRDERRKAN